MKKLLIFLALIVACSSIGIAQDIAKKYTTAVGEDGYVYFIMPQKGFKSKQLPKDVAYDITYNTKNDSVNYNFTYYSHDAVSVDSVGMVANGKETMHRAKIFYVSPKGNLWKSRVGIHPQYTLITEMHAQESPYKLKIYVKGKTYLMEMSKGEWKKQSAIVRKIQQVIELNKKIAESNKN